jgi:unsaturated rhamnogalacturonyl hydrolase
MKNLNIQKTTFRQFLILCSIVLFFLTVSCSAANQSIKSNEKLIPTNKKWSERMALTLMQKHPKAYQIDGKTEPKWDYVHGLVLTGFEQLYKKTNNQKYFDYVKGYADSTIDENGKIPSYKFENYNIDMLEAGNILFDLYDKTKVENGTAENTKAEHGKMFSLIS